MALRIAHITATFPPYRGGTGNVCFYHARELARRGHDVHVFTARAPGAPTNERCHGIVIHRMRPILQVGNAPVLPELIRALRGFDIVHLHCPFIFGAELTALTAILWRIPLFVTYHNDLIGDGTWRDLLFQLATLSSRYVTLHHAQCVCFVSRGHAETCDQRVVYQRRQAQSRIVPNGVDSQAFCPSGDRDTIRRGLGLPLDAPVVGFVGGLDRAHHYKGLKVLLEAITMPRLHDAHLLIVGDGELKEHYRQQAYQLGLGERVVFHGAVGHDTLPALYSACDVVAMPSLVAESFGLVIVEALACGVPVVASAGPGTWSLLDHGVDGLLVEPGDVAALAAALEQVVRDVYRCHTMGQNGRAKVEAHYRWGVIGEQLESLYLHVFDHGRLASSLFPRGEP